MPPANPVQLPPICLLGEGGGKLPWVRAALSDMGSELNEEPSPHFYFKPRGRDKAAHHPLSFPTTVWGRNRACPSESFSDSK